MSEPLRTITVGATIVEVNAPRSPFVPTDSSRAFASTGGIDSPYSAAREGFFRRVRGLVRPVTPKYEKINSVHGRSMTESASSKKVVWAGNLPGDIFGARTVKGTSMGKVKLERLGDRESDFRGYGLLDDVDVSRIKRASEFLRENGLPTERPAAIKELKEILTLNRTTGVWETVPIETWEDRELENIKREDPKFYENAETYLKETKFIVMERDVQVDERIQDLAIAAKNNHLGAVLAPIFKWLNVATRVRKGGIISDTPQPELFEYIGKDLGRYFKSYLPSQMGIYLGRFHKLGLAHGYLHSQNWSAIGTILDPDSVYGLLIFSDDGPPTQNEIEGDIRDTFHTINELIEGLASSHEFKKLDIKNLEVQASYNFFSNYLVNRFGKITSEGIKILEGLNTRLDSTPEAIKLLKAGLPA